MNTPVNAILARANGINIFHPRFINWSYRNLGKVHLIHIKKKINPNIFIKNTITPIMVIQFCESPRSYIKGKLYPPKYRDAIKAEETNIFIYSENIYKPSFMAEYSV